MSGVRSTFFARFSQCYAHDMWGMHYLSVIRGFQASSVATVTTYGYLARVWHAENERLWNFFQVHGKPERHFQSQGWDKEEVWVYVHTAVISSLQHKSLLLLFSFKDVPWNLLSEKMNSYIVSWKGIKKSFLRVLTSGTKKNPVPVIRKGFSAFYLDLSPSSPALK